MGLLEKLKSLLGSGDDRHASRRGEAEVTVEHEPSAESEHAVKGTGGRTAADTGSPEMGDATARTGESETASTAETAEATGSVDAAADADGEAATEQSAGGDAATDEEPDRGTESPPVDEVKGIGPTYSGRLAEVGIETVADLAAADAETVAEAAETSVSRAEEWIERATDR